MEINKLTMEQRVNVGIQDLNAQIVDAAMEKKGAAATDMARGYLEAASQLKQLGNFEGANNKLLLGFESLQNLYTAMVKNVEIPKLVRDTGKAVGGMMIAVGYVSPFTWMGACGGPSNFPGNDENVQNDGGARNDGGVRNDGGINRDGGQPALKWSQVSAKGSTTCGVTTDGLVKCWGRNNYGAGNPPSGIFSKVSTGGMQTCGVTIDGALKCWGFTDGVPPIGSFIDVSVESEFACALRIDGVVKCWGENNFGQSSPPSELFTQISVGGWSACGITRDDIAKCWGFRFYGDNHSGTFTQVSVGTDFACGVKINGLVDCWGPYPALSFGIALPLETFRQISATDNGSKYVCGVKTDRHIECWGNNEYGQASSPSGTYTQVSAGYNHSCGVTMDHKIICWGDNTYGQATPPTE